MYPRAKQTTEATEGKEDFLEDLKVNGKALLHNGLARVKKLMEIMSPKIESALKKGGANEEKELWHVFREYIDDVHAQGGKVRGKKGKKVPVPPTILNWAIAFLAKTSASVYNEVQKVMKLPHISYIYKKTAEMVSTLGDKAYAINIDTICEIGECN